MKKTHIVLIFLIALSVGAIIATISNASTYVTFQEAEKNMGKEFTVIGELVKDKEILYNPKKNELSFYAVDSLDNVRKVYHYQPKPQDFERSEKITMTGYAKDSTFVATTILMKCPSKYEEQQTVSR